MSIQLFAGNTGKIAGVITDKQSGETLIGANVILIGTNLGAASRKNGSYYILQVPPGIYEMKVSYIGYKTVTIKDVRVNVDLTTKIDVATESQAIAGLEVLVIAQQKVIQHDVTSTRKTTSREDIDRIPGLESTTDVFKLRGGTFIDQIPQKLEIGGTEVQVRDESLKDIHVRGGRGGEILYMIDGMPVTHPIYGGRNVLDLNLDDVQEIELLTGAFNAEYGQAQSGV
ncbi:MAG: carboxypeptidase-like regulatory domain-containing protein, partial [Candidatus Marinimicrobia bacterium]|nr:carboxypeptidase-like regulatory domain-containing protein [Candidatus Neomarinimicrobiota bacterium]